MNIRCWNHPISFPLTRTGSSDHLDSQMSDLFVDPGNKEKVVYRVNYGSKDKSLLQFINSMNSNISTINNSSTKPQNTFSNRLLESQTFKKKEVKIIDKMGKEMPWGNYEFEVIDTIDLTV